MLPRSKLDIGWSDIFFGIGSCLLTGNRVAMQRRVESLWSMDSDAMACLSVRTGFDLLLTALDYPPGSEILVSAITIRDMVRIVEHHGLVPIPVDLDLDTLSLKIQSLDRLISEKTKAILVAHLFGSRMPLDEVAAFARAHNILLIEDCAQSFTGDPYRGNPGSDVSMFSFGPIKTSTALGGAMFRIKDRRLCEQTLLLQSQYPVQSRGFFFKRLCKYLFLVLLTHRAVFSVFEVVCRALGKNHDQVISGAVRGFPGPNFFTKIRYQPSYPLLALLHRRLTRFNITRFARRVANAQAVARLMPTVRRPGERAAFHSHWIFPIQVSAPDELMRFLWRKGFDATRGASSLHVVDAPSGRKELTPTQAQDAMQHLLYVPVYPEATQRDIERLAQATIEFERRNSSHVQ